MSEPAMSGGDYLVGLAFFGGTVLCVGLASWRVVRMRVPELRGACRCTAIATVAMLALIGVQLVPGILGVLSRTSVLLAAAALLCIAWRRAPARPVLTAGQLRRPSASRVARLLALAGAGAMVVVSLALVARLVATPPLGVDMLTFHLPTVGRWMQSQSLWGTAQFIPGVATGQYPNNGDLMDLAVVLPWSSDFAIRLVDLPFLAVLGVATYASGRELDAPKPAAVLGAAVLVASPIVTHPALELSVPDIVLLAGLACGVLFLLRHARAEQRSDLVLAGLGLGVAFGTKWYGVTSIPVVLAVWCGAMLLARRSLAQVIRWGVELFVLVLAGGGFWLLRNLIESGNPFFPAKVSVFGATLFDAPPDARGPGALASIAEYLGDPHILAHYIAPPLRGALALPGLLLAAATGATIVIGVRMLRRGRLRGASTLTLALAVGALLLAVVYVVTPSTAAGQVGHPSIVGENARYAGPALVLAAPAAAWLVGRAGRLRILLEVVALLAIADGIAHGPLPTKSAIGVALALTALGAGAAIASRGRQEGHHESRWALAVSLIAVCFGVLIIGGHRLQRAFQHRGYRTDQAVTWVDDHAPSGHRIGLVGLSPTGTISPVRGLFGPRFANQVAYVGPSLRHELWYFDRVGPFRAALRSKRYDLLLVAHVSPRLGTGIAQVPYDRWALSSNYRPVARSPFLTLYRASPSTGTG